MKTTVLATLSLVLILAGGLAAGLSHHRRC